jgi:hypothetical protein
LLICFSIYTKMESPIEILKYLIINLALKFNVRSTRTSKTHRFRHCLNHKCFYFKIRIQVTYIEIETKSWSNSCKQIKCRIGFRAYLVWITFEKEKIYFCRNLLVLMPLFSYISPELLEQNYCPPSADLWALGCIIYQLYYLETPFKDNY